MRAFSLLLVVTLGSSCQPSAVCGVGTGLVAGECVPVGGQMSCGSGTTAQGDQCVAVVQCGAGTVNTNGNCLPQNPLACGAGTTAQNGTCTAALQTCGAGTTVQGTSCVATVQSCGAGASLQSGVCVAALQSCGTGTTAQGSSCVATLQACGAGTIVSGTQCVSQGLTCGTGTTAVGNLCSVNFGTVCSTDTVASGASCVGRVTCATGTTRVGDACQPQLATLCGPGTRSVNGRCELNPTACGAGTVLNNGQCVLPTPVPSFTTFTSSTSLNVAYDHEDYYYMTGYRTWHRVIITDLSAGNAVTWATNEISPVGVGSALHLKIDGLSLSTGSTLTRAIADGRWQGACDTSLTPTELAATTSQTYANFFGWNNAMPSMVVCGAAGSVMIERLNIATVDSVRITLNVQFSDGTVWTDKIFTTPYR